MKIALFRSHAPLFLAVFLDIFSFGLMYPLIVSLFDGAGPGESGFGAVVSVQNRDTLMALAFALFPVGAFFGCSLLGDLSDALGRRRTLVACMAGLAVAYALMWVSLEAGHLWLFYLGRLVAGLMSGTSAIAQASMVDAVAPEERGSAMAQVSLVNTIGLIAGPAIGGLLGHLDPRAPLAVAFGLCAANAVLLARARFAETGVRRALGLDWKQPFLLFLRLRERPATVPPLAAFFLFQLGFLVYYTFILVEMQRSYGLSTAGIGLFSVMLGVGGMLGSVGLYGLVSRWLKVERRIASVGLGACGALVLMAALPLGVAAQVVLAVASCATNVLGYVALLSAASGLVEETERGWVLGLSSALVALCVFLSGLLTQGLVLLPPAPFIGLGGVLVLAALLPVRSIADTGREDI